MVARGTEPVALALGPEAALGRTITTADGTTHEIPDDRMSREHVRVRFERGRWVIVDLESRNGTFVNALRIAGEVHRRGDTVLRCGHSVFLLLADASGHPSPLDEDIGPEQRRAHDRIREAAAADKPLLLTGGTEAEARMYHAASARHAGPFVAVACANLPEGVAERLLFGAKKGFVESIGHFQMAKGGTIFFDDVSVLAANVQAKLLRVIEKRAIELVGATHQTPIDVGIVAGAHAELRLAVADDRFDPELYKRLAKTSVQLPPLRERRVDVARIIQRELAKLGLAAHAKLVEACLVRPWPGDTSELAGAIAKAAATATSQQRDVVRVDDLDPTVGLSASQLVAETAVDRPKRDTPPADIDKPQIEAALVRANGVIHIAARILGIHRTQLYQLMDKHGIVFEAE